MGDLALAFCGGMLGSAHCVGMCGAFALAIGGSGLGWLENARRQCVYTLGRMGTYGCAGMGAAFLGSQLQSRLPQWIPAQSLLSIFAGLVLVAQGLAILGLPGRRWLPHSGRFSCQAATAFREMMTAPSLIAVFLAGVATGFLPCALIYAYLALAARSGDLLIGALLMVAMAAGTAPLMIVTGLGTSSLRLTTRQQILKVAAILVLLTGFASLVRGVGYFHASHDTVPQQCPICRGR